MAPTVNHTTIHVSNLPTNLENENPAAIDNFIRSLFSKVGRVVPGPFGVIFKPKGDTSGQLSALVTFETREEAVNAINELNYTQINNSSIQLRLADKETNHIRRSGRGLLYVRNLDPTIEVSQLHHTFAIFGDVISCEIPTNNGQRCDYGIVQFRNPNDAEIASTDFKDASINGHPVQIEFKKPQQLKIEDTFKECFIKDLPKSIKTKEDLKRLFEEFGTVESSRIVITDSGVNLDMGYCVMSTHEDAVRAVKGFNKREMEGKVLKCNRAMTESEKNKYYNKQYEEWCSVGYERFKKGNLIVHNLDETVTEDELSNYFSQFGEIESCQIIRDQENGESTNMGFISAKSEEIANKCISESLFILFKDKQLFVARDNENF